MSGIFHILCLLDPLNISRSTRDIARVIHELDNEISRFYAPYRYGVIASRASMNQSGVVAGNSEEG